MKRKISTSHVVKQNENIIASDIDDEKVMMSIEKGYYYGLDSVGSRVWDLIDKSMKVSDLVDELMMKYDVERETCEEDVMAFLGELLEAGIVRVEG